MSKLSPINADEATKAAVVAYASERGISQTKALAEMIRGDAFHPPQEYSATFEIPATDVGKGLSDLLHDRWADLLSSVTWHRFVTVAAERSQSPAETLSAALDALARPASEPVLGIDWTGEQIPAETVAEMWRFCEREGKSWQDGVRRMVDYAFKFADQPLSPAIVQPAEKLVRTWCGCDGEDGPGPWHRLGCERRTA